MTSATFKRVTRRREITGTSSSNIGEKSHILKLSVKLESRRCYNDGGFKASVKQAAKNRFCRVDDRSVA